MRRFVPLFLALLFATAVAAAATAAPSQVAVARAANVEQGIVERLNAIREARDLRPLTVSRSLRQAAVSHSEAMATAGIFQHESPDGSPFWKRVGRYYGASGYSGWQVGENILWRTAPADAADAVQQWMQSPPHRKNILNPAWREIGVGVVTAQSAPGEYRGLEVLIATTDFGVRAKRS